MADSTRLDGPAAPGGRAPLADRSVARVGFGAMQLPRLHADRAEAIALVRRAVGLGVDHIDTAEFYGNGFSNAVLADAIPAEADVLVATKVGAEPDPASGRLRLAQRLEQLRAGVEANLRSLRVEWLPLVNLRRADKGHMRAQGDQVVDLDDQLGVMSAMRDEGLIEAIGLSNVSVEQVERALPVGIACVQNVYSLLDRQDEDLLRLCAAEGIAWVPFFPLGRAFTRRPKVTDEPVVQSIARALDVSPAQVGLAWLLHHSPNTLLIPGTASAEHLDANVAAGAVSLDESAMRALDAVSRDEGTR